MKKLILPILLVAGIAGAMVSPVRADLWCGTSECQDGVIREYTEVVDCVTLEGNLGLCTEKLNPVKPSGVCRSSSGGCPGTQYCCGFYYWSGTCERVAPAQGCSAGYERKVFWYDCCWGGGGEDNCSGTWGGCGNKSCGIADRECKKSDDDSCRCAPVAPTVNPTPTPVPADCEITQWPATAGCPAFRPAVLMFF